jgi:hypothetical protein
VPTTLLSPPTPTATSATPARLRESSRGSGAIDSGGTGADIGADGRRAPKEGGGSVWCILRGHAQPAEGGPASEKWSSTDRRRGSSGHRRSRGGSHTHGMPSGGSGGGGGRLNEDRREGRGSRTRSSHTCGLSCGQGSSEVIVRGRCKEGVGADGSSRTRREQRGFCARGLGDGQGNSERIGSRRGRRLKQWSRGNGVSGPGGHDGERRASSWRV